MITLYWVTYTGENPQLVLGEDKYAEQCRPATREEATLELMAECLDHDAENRNAHDFACSHLGLAALLIQEVGREAATKLMRRLAGYGGLHGMTGVCGAGDGSASEDLGVKL